MSDREHPGDARVWEEDLEAVVPDYGVDDVPPPLETLLYAWQHTLVDVSPFVLPLMVAGAVGYGAEQAAYMISACLVLMGLATFANATWGNRLPSVLGPSATDTGAMATAGRDLRRAGDVDGRLRRRADRDRRRAERRASEAAALPAALRLRHRSCSPSALRSARVAGGWLFADPRPEMLGLAGAAVASILLLTVARPSAPASAARARRHPLQPAALRRRRRRRCSGSPTSRPCARAHGSGCRASSPSAHRVWAGSSWAERWLGVLIGYIGSIAEAIGDYAGTCAVSGVIYRVRHMHRGITVEGIASALAPFIGALPLTTYSQNTGVIATTRVASRRVVQVAAMILLLYGLSPKLGTLLVVIPRPVVGAVFLVICGMIAVAGLRLLACGQEGRRLLPDHRVDPRRRAHPAARGERPERSGSPPCRRWRSCFSPTAW